MDEELFDPFHLVNRMQPTAQSTADTGVLTDTEYVPLPGKGRMVICHGSVMPPDILRPSGEQMDDGNQSKDDELAFARTC